MNPKKLSQIKSWTYCICLGKVGSRDWKTCGSWIGPEWPHLHISSAIRPSPLSLLQPIRAACRYQISESRVPGMCHHGARSYTATLHGQHGHVLADAFLRWEIQASHGPTLDGESPGQTSCDIWGSDIHDMVSYERGVEAHEGKTILFQHLNLFIHTTYAYSDGAAICTAMFLIFRWLDTLTVPHWAGYSLLDGSRCSPKKEETSFFFVGAHSIHTNYLQMGSFTLTDGLNIK